MNSPGHQSRALIVDDHHLFRAGLRLLLQDTIGIQSIAEAGNLDEALAAVANPNLPDLVTYDLSMPAMSGLEGLAALIDTFPTARILVISASEERSDVLSVLGAGGHGFVPKTFSSDQISDAIARVLDGQVFVPFSLSATRPTAPLPVTAINAAERAHTLNFTPRQLKVLELLMTGVSTRRIASALNLAEGTVKIHLAGIYRAAGVHSRSEAIVKLKDAGWRIGDRQKPE